MTVGFGSSSTAELEGHLGIAGAVPNKKVSFRNVTTRSMSLRSATVKSAVSAQPQLALFLSPPELTFVANDRSNYRQSITILNPYDFDVRFEVFCTNANRYETSPSSGRVTAMSSLDLTVRLRDPGDGNAHDRFRFRITELSNRSNVLGEREVPVTIVPESTAPAREPPRAAIQLHPRTVTRPPVNHVEDVDRDLHPVFMVIIGMVCLFGLCLPTPGETPSSWIGQHVTLTVNQKLIAAFVLGMVTTVLFRSR